MMYRIRSVTEKHFLYILLLLYALLGILTVHYCNGTGDVGDSIMHYLFARSAPLHPELYFDHWAKPVYVLLASPFAQLGFNGIKLFNLLNTLVTLFLIYQIARELQMGNPIVAVLLAMCSPLYFAHTFSGLTEPLFALFTALGIYLCLRKKILAACVVLSFLPYVRSEGLIIIGVFALYFLYVKKWKFLPWLFAGSLLYGIAGYFVHRDLLWVFTKIPYASAHSVYGSGKLFHFVDQLYYVIGMPVYVLFWIGFLFMIVMLYRKKMNAEFSFIILLGFISFFRGTQSFLVPGHF